MESLLTMARELGEAISRDDRTTKLKQAQDVVDADPEAEKLVKDYQVQMDKVADLTRRNEPVEVNDKHLLQELEGKLAAHPALSELMRRQVDFVDMMRKVKEAIDQALQIKV